MKRSIWLLALLAAGSNIWAQAPKHSISGTVKEQASGETLTGVNVLIGDGTLNTATNEYGFYSISAPCDTVTVVFMYTGYNTRAFRFYLDRDTTLSIELNDGVEMDEIAVSASSAREKVNSTQMGVNELTIKEAKEIPAIFGEVDILKVLQLKPGVQSGGEGSSGIYVRGGGSDQNLFILDEAPVYNPNHLFGFFSTFNSDAVKNVVLYKAGFPAQYGGKLSSVIEVFMKEGNRKRFAGSGGLGLISSRLTLEGPFAKSKGSFVVSGRRTYVDVFTELFNKAKEDDPNWNKIPRYSFYDLNAKINFEISPKDRIFLSGYFGRDVFTFNGGDLNFNFDWGNATGTARWNHIFNPKLFANTAFTFSDYLYDISTKFDQFGFTLGSGIRDANLKADFDYFPNNQHAIKFGANAIYHRFSVNRFDAGAEDSSFTFQSGNIFKAGEFAAYLGDDWTINDKLKINFGGRASGFVNQGKFYWGLEPRVSAKYSLSKDLSLKASYARMYQYIHLVSTSGASLPTDVWYPSNPNVRPQSSDLVSIGAAYALGDDFFFSWEGYYKWLHNQIDFRDGANLVTNGNLDNEFVFGKGWSYGSEFYVEKKVGDWRGWVGYTLAWNWRKFADIMDGKPFHPRFDRRHDISVVLMYDIPKTPITLSATWVYGTGNAISLPVARYFNTGVFSANPFQFVPVYTERNGYRMPAYHRADLGMVWNLNSKKPEKRFQNDLTLSIYNVYSRLNAFFIYIDAEYPEDSRNNAPRVPTRFQAKVVSLFPIIPSVTWNFKF